MRGAGNPRRKWLSKSTAVTILVVLMLASVWTVAKMGSSGIFLPFIFNDFTVCGIAPELSSPGNGIQLDTLAPLFIGKAGNDPSGQSVYIEISLDEKFEHIVRTLAANNGTGEFSSRSVDNLEPGAAYFWRAQLICSRKSSPFSAPQSFFTPSLVSLPSKVQLNNPENEAAGIELPIKFTWEPVAGVDEYLVYFRPDGPHGWYYGATTDPWLNRNLLKGTKYEWYVVPHSKAGYGEASEIHTFTTIN